MKKPDVILWLIVLILAGFLIQGRHKLVELRTKQQDLVKHNDEQTDDHQNSAGRFRVSLRSSPKDNRAAAEKLIADWRDVANIDSNSPQEVARRELAKLTAFDRLRRIDPEHWAYIIKNFEVIDNDEQEELLAVMVDRNPRRLIDIVLNSTASDQIYGSKSALSEALKFCGEKDPSGMIDWMLAHFDEYPNVIGDDQKLSLLNGASKADPMLALKSISKLKISERAHIKRAMDEVFENWDDSGARMKKLQAIRAFREELDDKELYYGSSYEEIVFGDDNENPDFHKITAFIKSANFTQDELSMIAFHAKRHMKKHQEADWIKWVNDQNISEKRRADITKWMMESWTARSFEEASKWMKMDGDLNIKKICQPVIIDQFELQVDIDDYIISMPEGELRNHAEQYVTKMK